MDGCGGCGERTKEFRERDRKVEEEMGDVGSKDVEKALTADGKTCHGPSGPPRTLRA